MFAKSLFAVAFVASTAFAQSTTTASSAAASGSATVSTSAIAAEVSGSLKASWCNGQQNTCKILCNNAFEANSCDATTLSWNCTCNNGTSPGLQYYATSIDAFTCQQAYTDCIAAHPNDQAGQDACTTNYKDNCGTLDVASYSAAATTASSSTTSSSGGSSTATSSASTTSASAAATSSHAAAIGLGQELSLGVVGAGLLAAFGFLL